MTTRELLEMAQIDALGLLDELEREEFDRAVTNAPPAVQAQVRAAQDRFVKTPWMPEPVEPPTGLRDAVLSDIGAQTMKPRVMAAIREEIRKSTREIAIKAVEPAARHAAGRNIPEISKVKRVTPWWRAAALGLLGASVVFGYTTLLLMDKVEEMSSLARNEGQFQPLVAIPKLPVTDLLFNAQTKITVLTSLNQGSEEASVVVSPDRSSVRLFSRNMPRKEGMEYRVVATNDDGNEELVYIFTGDTGYQAAELDKVNPARCIKLAIVLAPTDPKKGAGQVILSGGPLLS